MKVCLRNANETVMLSEGCLNFSSLWEQVLGSCAHSRGHSSLTYMLKQEYTCCGGLSEMDISILEEQYNCRKQQQKLQSHVIVFRTVNPRSISGEALVSAVLVNADGRQPTAYQDHIFDDDDDGFTLDMLCNTSLQDHNAPWLIHLGINHDKELRNAYSEDEVTDADEEMTLENEGLSSSPGNESPANKLLTCEVPVTMNATHEHKDMAALHDVARSSTDFLLSVQMEASPSNATPVVFTNQHAPRFLAESYPHYPFPQKKTPRKSEVAKKLGLYSEH
ncbi:uncharacterized protein LOC122797684 [Protopterus annectens]|uniref:uncharacterized protein LOC122797684 n=1 Tax=Protopterus annectens TaxID=7888 RepID=UPI001CFADA81|nr:uncharacterized protein LOC122797684 [Protopterus annectens]